MIVMREEIVGRWLATFVNANDGFHDCRAKIKLLSVSAAPAEEIGCGSGKSIPRFSAVLRSNYA